MEFRRSTKRNEQGYLLLSVMLLITIMLIMLAAEAPRVAQQIKRAKEEELVSRGKEYAIAVRKYVHKMGNYPTSLEQLEDTNHIRFLRKRYTDPITGKADWKLVHVGEAEIKIPQNVNSTLQTTNPSITASNGGLQQNPPGGNGTGAGGLGLPTSTPNPSPNGQTFGGGGIIGVASTSKGTGIKEFNGNSEYDQWLFVYDPKLEQATASFGGAADAGIVVAAPRAGAASGSESSAPSGSPAPGGSPAPTGNSNPNATPNPSPTP